MSRYDQPVLAPDGSVLYAPNPRALVTAVSRTVAPGEGMLYLGGSWRAYPRRDWYSLVVTVCGTSEGSEPPGCRRHIAWPLRDDGRIDARAVDAIVGEVVDSIRAGEDVLIQCYTGQNRSGLIVALAMTKLYGMSGDEAIEHLRAVRSPTVLCNPAFEAYVRAAD